MEWCDEAKAAEMVKDHKVPSDREVREHNLTHLPFRAWCKHCVFGRAKNDPHLSKDREPSEKARTHWDYAY